MGVHQFLSQSSSFTSCDVQVCCMQSGLTSDWEWSGWFVWHSYLGNIKNILNLIGVYWTSLYYNIAQIKYYDPIITSAKQDATWSSTLLPKSLDGQLCQLYLVKKNMHQQKITKDFAICDVRFTPETFNKTLRVESKTHTPCQPHSMSLESASVHSGQSTASCAKHALVGRHLGKSLSGMKLNDGFTRLCQQKK